MKIDFYNKDLLNLVKEKQSKFKYIPLPDAWLKRLNKPTKQQVKAEKEEFLNKIENAYLVNKDQLAYMVLDSLARDFEISHKQPDNKWKNDVVNLPVKRSKDTTKPYQCVFFGGTFKNYSDYKQRVKVNKEGEKVYNEVIDKIEEGHLIVLYPTVSDKVDLSIANPQNIGGNYPSVLFNEYPLVRYGEDWIYGNKKIHNVLDNLVCDNLVKSGVLTKEEVKQTLKDDYIEVPALEIAKDRSNIKYNYKDEAEPEFNYDPDGLLK